MNSEGKKKTLNLYVLKIKRLWLVLGTCSLLLVLREASCHVLPYGEVQAQGTERGLQPAASKELNSANDQVSEFGSGSFST